MATQNTNTAKKEPLQEIGAAWKRKSKTSGENYLNGTFKVDGKDIPFIAFSNKNKKTDGHPDLKIYLSKPRTGTAPVKPQPAKPVETPVVESATPSDDNDLI